MAIEIRNDCSLMAQRITMLREQPDGAMLRGATGTGSYWKDENIWHLITNWHNLTGCNPVTGQALSETGFLPTHVEISMLSDDPSERGSNMKRWRRLPIPLYDEGNRARWFEHPVYRSKVDVIALPLFDEESISLRIFSIPINRPSGWFNIRLQPGDDAFVLGYPKNLDGGGQLPLWKRASLASEPLIDNGGLPRLLIDTATRKGMSGAPVIAVSTGWNIPVGGEIDDAVIGRVEAFLGIYSGRSDDDQLGVQIGIVWKAITVPEIVNAKVPGHNPLNP